MAGILLLRMRGALGLRAAMLKPNAAILRGIAAIAVPLALEQFFFNSGKAFSQRFIAGYGTGHMAANGVINAVFNLINIPQATLTAAAVTVAGMCIGRGRPELGKAYIDKFIRTIRWVLLGLMPLTVPLSALLVYLYRVSDQARVLSALGLGIIFVMSPLFLAGSFTAPAGLRAGGDAVYVSACALGCMWTVRVGFSYVFTVLLPWGVVGLNLAMVIEWALRTALYRLRLNTGRWYRHKLIES